MGLEGGARVVSELICLAAVLTPAWPRDVTCSQDCNAFCLEASHQSRAQAAPTPDPPEHKLSQLLLFKNNIYVDICM